MFYLLPQANPDIPSGNSANPEGFAARFINQLEASGYSDEMNRLYGK
jgi:hypothetical protein